MRDAIIQNVQIAVVDFERMTRDFLVDVMMYCVNREVHSFGDADAMISFLRSGNRIDLLVSDVYLPGRSGFELLRLIKTQYPDIYFIAISTNPADYTPAIELGADVFLTKPFALQDLFDIVQRFVIDRPDLTSRKAAP